jgi:hypothetical protein
MNDEFNALFCEVEKWKSEGCHLEGKLAAPAGCELSLTTFDKTRRSSCAPAEPYPPQLAVEAYTKNLKK